MVEAAQEAAQILVAAEARAARLLAEAEHQAEATRLRATLEGRVDAETRLAAAWIHLRTQESARDERDLDRSIALARAMAERILGESLTLTPAKILTIARHALSQVRRARSVSLYAHPEDADTLRTNEGALGLEGADIQIHADAARPRGSLSIRTDLGSLDADLSPQLDRLTAALRDTLRSAPRS
jgi:flagellar biosynthesis/type III secretory pathway protein FliH